MKRGVGMRVFEPPEEGVLDYAECEKAQLSFLTGKMYSRLMKRHLSSLLSMTFAASKNLVTRGIDTFQLLFSSSTRSFALVSHLVGM